MCFQTTKTQDTQSGSTTTLPSWLTNASQQVGQQAANYASNNSYNPYTGPTQAAFGSTFGTAENAATQQLAGGNQAYTSGQQALGQGLNLAAGTASTPIAALMSGYTQSALAPTLQAIQTQAAQTNQGLGQQATMSGAFGDSGYATQRALNNSYLTQNIAGAEGSAYDKAYNSALSTQQTALGQLMSGVGQASGLGSASSSSQTNLESLLGQLGSTVQSAGQTGLNFAANINNQNQLGQLQMDALAGSTLASLPRDTSTTGYQNTQYTQPDNSGLGLLGTLIAGLPKLSQMGSTGS